MLFYTLIMPYEIWILNSLKLLKKMSHMGAQQKATQDGIFRKIGLKIINKNHKQNIFCMIGLPWWNCFFSIYLIQILAFTYTKSWGKCTFNNGSNLLCNHFSSTLICQDDHIEKNHIKMRKATQKSRQNKVH